MSSNDIILAHLMANPSVMSLTLSELSQVLQLATKRFWSTVDVSKAGENSPHLEATTVVTIDGVTLETGWRVTLG